MMGSFSGGLGGVGGIFSIAGVTEAFVGNASTGVGNLGEGLNQWYRVGILMLKKKIRTVLSKRN